MLKRTTIHAVMFAGAITLALAAPAHADTVKWHGGPVGLISGQIAQVAVGNPEIFPCTIGIRLLASPRARVGTTLTNALLSTVKNTSLVRPAANVQTVGFSDPAQMPGERRLVATQVTANCPGIAASRVREFGVTLQIVNGTTGETGLIQGMIIEGS